MTQQIEIKGLDKLQGELAQFQELFSPETLLPVVGEMGRSRIFQRTLLGRDATGMSFAPYSPSYAEWKGSTHVNLRLTGDMLNAMKVRVKRQANVGEIYFADGFSEEKMVKHMTGSQVPTRQFFALSDDDISAISDQVSEYVDEVLKRAFN